MAENRTLPQTVDACCEEIERMGMRLERDDTERCNAERRGTKRLSSGARSGGRVPPRQAEEMSTAAVIARERRCGGEGTHDGERSHELA